MKRTLSLAVCLALSLVATAAFASHGQKTMKLKPAVTGKSHHSTNWFVRMFTLPHGHHAHQGK